MSDAESDDQHHLPLQLKRAFGAGLSRKRINFVPQAAPATHHQHSEKPHSASVGDVYLAIVLPKAAPSATGTTNPTPPPKASTLLDRTLCTVCHLPLQPGHEASMPHEASLAHQVCLAHSHPPSALDRQRKGMAFLSAYGWDPDERRGLGASGEGRLYPIQPKARADNRGVGAVLRPELKVVKQKKLHAGDVRRDEEEKRRKGRRMERLFHADDRVNRYLGLDVARGGQDQLTMR